tara:strand:- start:736 stop:909 length:174 start_codon:yes stop_codon:yes gene_type:complete
MKGGKKVMSIQDEVVLLAKLVAVKDMQVYLLKEEKKLKEELAELKSNNKAVTANAKD